MIVKYEGDTIAIPINEAGTNQVLKAVLIGGKEGAPNFTMRRFDIGRGGYTPFHTHDWEHVVYILEGLGTLKSANQQYELKAGTSVFVAPDEAHQFQATADSPLSFLCSVPMVES